MSVRGSGNTKWSPLTIVALATLVVAILYLAPLQGLLVLGLWLVCPLLMIGMHASGRHHGSQH